MISRSILGCTLYKAFKTGRSLYSGFDLCSIKEMILLKFLVFFIILTSHVCDGETDDDLLYDTFPDGFLWGTATSSYQIEGAWNVDGKLHIL